MRALGPGSVSSLLKLALDVIGFTLWAALGVLVLGAFIALLLPVDLDIWKNIAADAGFRDTLRTQGPLFSLGLGALAAYVGVVLWILRRVQKIFATLTAGDPFHPDNVGRLRAVGFGLAALEGVNYATRFITSWAFSDQVDRVRFSPNLTAWFAVLVVFVLAEVFREGARLRREAELTI